jgi:uncharacterized DUF497 family protein
MQVYIQWHEEKRRTNLCEHGIDFIDLVDFFDGELITDEDVRYEYAEARFQSIGILSGFVLSVVWVPTDIDATRIRLISARKATQRETQEWFHRYGIRH